jgi:sugar (pentulose or hexulose) kinase
MNIIAIDCGASFIKGALMCVPPAAKNTVARDRTYSIKEKYYKSTLKFSGNSQLLIKNILTIATEIIEKFSLPGETVHLGISNEMHGFIITDKDGNERTDYISWQSELIPNGKDKDSYLTDITGIIPEQDIMNTGMPLKLGLPSVNLYYLFYEKILTRSTSESTRHYFYTLGDYLIRVISGKQPYVHPTNAAATGLYDIQNQSWNKNILKNLHIDESICFPEICGTKTIACDFLNRNLIIYPAIGDQQAALYGAGLFEESTLSLNLGTGAQASIVTSSVKIPLMKTAYQTRPYLKYGTYLNTIPHIPSGRALNIFFKFIKEIIIKFNKEADDDAIWEYIIEQSINNNLENLEIDMSFFSNAISDKRTGHISNIKENNFSIGNLFLSIYKTIAKNTYIAAEKLTDLNKIKKIVFTGGVVNKNPSLQKMILDEFEFIHGYHIETEETFKGILNYIADFPINTASSPSL